MRSDDDRARRFALLRDLIGHELPVSTMVQRSRYAQAFLDGDVDEIHAEKVASTILFHRYLFNETDFYDRARNHVHFRTLELCDAGVEFQDAFKIAKSEIKEIKKDFSEMYLSSPFFSGDKNNK